MSLRVMIANFLIISASAELNSEFIFDYFVFKKSTKIVGFSCNNVEDQLIITKRFSELGVTINFGRENGRALINSLKNSKYYKLGVIVDLHCNNAEAYYSIFSEAAAARLYDELHHWLIISPNLDYAVNLIDDERFNLSTDLVVAVGDNLDSYNLYDLYNPLKYRGGRLNITFLGSWNQTNGLFINLTQNKYLRRADLHGMVWKVSFFGSKYRPKNVSMSDHFKDLIKTGTKDAPSKLGYNIITPLIPMLNISIELGEFVKWKKGDKLGPLTKALAYEEIELNGTPISVFGDKMKFIKFVFTAWPFRTCFIFRTPPIKDIKVREVLSPLDENVWILSWLMFVLFILTLYFSFLFEGTENCKTVKLFNSFIITIGCYCQQATTINMDLISTRIVFISIMIFSLLIYNYYSASVVSAKLNEPIIKLNDSLDALAMTDFKVASEPMLYFDFIMKERGQEIDLFNRNVWLKTDEKERFMKPEQGMELVRHGSFAYHLHPEVGYPYVAKKYDNREICELSEVHLARPTHRSMAVSYNSSFYEISKIMFLKIGEVGVHKRQLNRWRAKKPECRKDILSASSTTIYEFAPHLILLAIGFVDALVIFIIEVLVHHYFIRYPHIPSTVSKEKVKK